MCPHSLTPRRLTPRGANRWKFRISFVYFRISFVYFRGVSKGRSSSSSSTRNLLCLLFSINPTSKSGLESTPRGASTKKFRIFISLLYGVFQKACSYENSPLSTSKSELVSPSWEPFVHILF